MKEKRRKKRKLNERDIEIIKHISTGFSDADIAKKINISISRVRQLIFEILKDTHSTNRPHLVYKAYKKGLIE